MYEIIYMNWWLSLLLFIIVLFSYIHVQHQYKTSNELEIYEYDYTSTEDLYGVCKWKQPVLFSLELSPLITDTLPKMNIRSVQDYLGDDDKVKHSYLPYHSAMRLIDTDTNGVYYSDQNRKQIYDSKSWSKWFNENEVLLRPSLNIMSQYDLIYGARKSHTITKYHKETSRFLYLPPGHESLRIRMCPYSFKHIIRPKTDYVTYEMYSTTDLFELNEDNQILEFALHGGSILSIPPYWFYSIEFMGKNSVLCEFTYSTLPNVVANAKDLAIYFTQQQNIIDMRKAKSDPVKTPTEKTKESEQTVEDKKDVLPTNDTNDTSESPTPNKEVVEEMIEELKPKENI